MPLLTEDSPLTKLLRKPEAAALAKNKGVETVGDLLELVPRKYLPPNELTDLSRLRVGENVLIVAEVAAATTRPMRNRRGKLLNVTLADAAGNQLDVTFFNAYGHERKLLPGVRGFFVGQIGAYGRRLQLTHPDYELIGEDEAESEVEYYRTHWVPVYSVTGKLNAFRMRKLVHQALDSVDHLREPVPDDLRERRSLLGRADALELVHRPRLTERPDPGMRRLKYDEAFVLQTILAQRRKASEAVVGTPRRPREGGLLAAFDRRLPFELTEGQRVVGDVLLAELGRDRPMHRLLQGEVGSGKTVVALRAMLAAVDAGGQAALLAPTEVLAAQHHRSISGMLGDLAMGGMLGGSDIGTKVALLTGSQSAGARRAALLDAASGAAGIVIGTHALIQKHVQFADLALVVVDEQHRFGVEQRDALREKGATPPHVLVMTATPIPRTVAMTVFGDMETSTLRELPRGRSPIATHVVRAEKPGWMERTWQRVAEEVAQGHQAYVVCPRIGDPDPGSLLSSDTSEEDAVDWEPVDWSQLDEGEGEWPDGDEGPEPAPARELTGVYTMWHELSSKPELAGVRIGVLHGRLDADSKEATMRAFAAGDIDVLVATTVIEVGVDVPNASVMVVIDADRFGISQLHQLRGRVGRGTVPGLCLLVTKDPGEPASERLDLVAATTDGFELARADLQFRREGDVLGARQSGRSGSIRHLRLTRPEDEEIIAEAREDAFALVETDAQLRRHPALAAAVATRLDEDQAVWLERG
ncbi:ATP-dependent DNA helicase RecG [Intrasporangium calvum]|uniref:Probable DNA 3'-5' helicase RecG n=1 Tax=Intrasporangium calvum TaxID=53358 RepID=A0ABT5GG48_9MICO|nr:ATP-dependent DNA helicase RecG [Intrasporangium calvum]MDC5697235.1 ATP-dependent DNA helicase RecG [Intrasporangium calvum]